MESRRDFLRLAAGALAPASRRPNLVLILADDMGFSDLGCYGGEIATPHLDALAAGGLRFTQAYSTARCVPSRSCLMTGYYAQQSGIDQQRPRPASWVRYLPQHLAAQGYRSYHSGKWHIPVGPVKGAGFRRSYWLGDQNRFFSPQSSFLDDQPLGKVDPNSGYYATTAIGENARQWIDEHYRSTPNDPFFLYLAFTSPHFPLHALEEDIARYRNHYRQGWDRVRQERWRRLTKMGIVNCRPAPLDTPIRPSWNMTGDEARRQIGPGEVDAAAPWDTLTAEQRDFQAHKMAIHAAMVHRMDIEVGRLINRLRAQRVLDDTLVVFLSDNGASAEMMVRADGHDPAAAPGSWRSHLCLGPGWASAANSPFRLHKSFIHEGGIASPMIAHWPAGIRATNRLRHTPAHFVDILPTFLSQAGVTPQLPPNAPPLPGRDLSPALTRDVAVPRDHIFFHHMDNRGLRQGQWKIVSAGKDAPWELYDLTRDRGETTNLAAGQPDRLGAMTSRWNELEARFRAQHRSGVA